MLHDGKYYDKDDTEFTTPVADQYGRALDEHGQLEKEPKEEELVNYLIDFLGSKTKTSTSNGVTVTVTTEAGNVKTV